MQTSNYGVGSADTKVSDLVASTSDAIPRDNRVFYSAYQVAKGDTLSEIADKFNVNMDSVISFNNIQAARSLRPGQILKVPNMSGILYTAKLGDTVSSIAEHFSVSADRLIETNGLLSSAIDPGKSLFLPDARLPSSTLREITGDLFKWPVRGVLTSWFAWRRDPFTGVKSFHNGIDIAVPIGTPIGAAMEGRVSETGYSPITGKYVMISHPGGWSTLYGHMSVILVSPGQYVAQGGRIGLSGNTGYSTGPHVHFSVFKYGRVLNPMNVLQ
jgi:murein DD-endopeptidase MepM/ murein hydrolase activator NlpD